MILKSVITGADLPDAALAHELARLILAGTKQSFGAKPARFCLLSMHYMVEAPSVIDRLSGDSRIEAYSRSDRAIELKTRVQIQHTTSS